MIKFYTIKQNKVNENGGGGGTPTEPKTPEAPKETGDSLDQFGYETAQAPVEPPKEGTPPTPPKNETPSDEVKDPGTGYGVEPPKAPEVEAPPAVEPPKVELGFEIETKDLPANEVAKIKEFAKANAMTKEQAQAFLDLRKSEVDAQALSQAETAKQEKIAIATVKSNWDKELRTDATFGGDKFAHNVARAEKVLAEFMPQTKKELTKVGSMLPPYVMRDLAKLADHLYSTEKLVRGDTSVSEETATEKPDSHLEFYE